MIDDAEVAEEVVVVESPRGEKNARRRLRTRWLGILKLYMEGMKQVDIAAHFNMDKGALSRVIHNPEFMRLRAGYEERVREEVREIFSSNATKAAKKIVKISESGKPTDKVKLEAAKEVLYQMGCKPTQVIETRQREFTHEELESSLLVMKEIEGIANRLSAEESRFLLTPAKQLGTSDSPLRAPVSGSVDAREVDLTGLAHDSDEEKIGVTGKESVTDRP